MTLRSKLVAGTLAITLIASSAVALVSCWFHGPAIAKHATHCQMMSEDRGLVSIQNILTGAVCCGRSVPTPVTQEPSRSVKEGTPTSGVSIVDVPLVTVGVSWINRPVRASGPHLQAILCVFLI